MSKASVLEAGGALGRSDVLDDLRDQIEGKRGGVRLPQAGISILSVLPEVNRERALRQRGLKNTLSLRNAPTPVR